MSFESPVSVKKIIMLSLILNVNCINLKITFLFLMFIDSLEFLLLFPIRLGIENKYIFSEIYICCGYPRQQPSN